MFPRDENINLCGVDTKIVTHSGRRSQLLLCALRCGHPSSYIGSSVGRASVPLCATSAFLGTERNQSFMKDSIQMAARLDVFAVVCWSQDLSMSMSCGTCVECIIIGRIVSGVARGGICVPSQGKRVVFEISTKEDAISSIFRSFKSTVLEKLHTPINDSKWGRGFVGLARH